MHVSEMIVRTGLVVELPFGLIFPCTLVIFVWKGSQQISRQCPCVLSNVHAICVYVPPIPSVKRTCRDDILRFLIESVDKISNRNPNSEIVICGDFNQFSVGDLICYACNLTCIFNGNTYNNSQLDYFLMTEILSESYAVTVAPLVDNSKVPHVSLMATPKNFDRNNETHVTSKLLFDTRESHVRNFVIALQNSHWLSVFRKDGSLDERAENFHNILYYSFSTTIPSYEIIITPRDKPWMTPLIKHLINLRWEAY